MATCRECLYFDVCLTFCTENVLKSRGVCERFKNKSYYVKRERGEWINNSNGTFICSVCGGSASKMNYCGHCGADMRKEDNNA